MSMDGSLARPRPGRVRVHTSVSLHPSLPARRRSEEKQQDGGRVTSPPATASCQRLRRGREDGKVMGRQGGQPCFHFTRAGEQPHLLRARTIHARTHIGAHHLQLLSRSNSHATSLHSTSSSSALRVTLKFPTGPINLGMSEKQKKGENCRNHSKYHLGLEFSTKRIADMRP
jgi:hypothetical protein